MVSLEYLSLYLGTDTASLFQQTLEACGNLRYSVDSVCSFKQNIQALGFDSCFGQLKLGKSKVSALTAELHLRRQNARGANRSSHALRSPVIRVRAIPVN